MSHIYSRHAFAYKTSAKEYNAIHGILWEVRTQSRQYVQLIISHRIALPPACTKQTWQRNLWCPFSEENAMKCCIRCSPCMLLVPFVCFSLCLCESTTGYMLLQSISLCNRKGSQPVSFCLCIRWWNIQVMLFFSSGDLDLGDEEKSLHIMNLNTFSTQL